MTSLIDDTRLYFPKYLTPESEKELLEELKSFPDNIDKRFYTNALIHDKSIFQGDGLEGFIVVNLPNPQISKAPCMVLSNTCDISTDNERPFPSAICYAPIFNLDKYKMGLLKRGVKSATSIDEHIKTIKKQRVTQIFYLPTGSNLQNESIVFLDRANNCSNHAVSREEVPKKRLFTLSNYGAWLFLLKLSVHFTRMADKVDRPSIH